MWLRIVIRAFNGRGIRDLQDIVEILLSDIASLYDAIWNRIPDPCRKRGGAMLQLVIVASELLPADSYNICRL